MTFKELNLHSKILQAVNACGFKEPTAIQEKAIPIVLTGVDLMASAKTGTGKTAAFVLPLLHRLLETKPGQGKGARVLVLTPTRELAMQIERDIKQFSKFCRLVSGNVLGGMAYGPQIELLKNSLDILVATPGRLQDHMKMGRVNYSRLEVLVLDEADRMLDMGFVHEVRAIASATPKTRQTLLFSATLEGAVLTIAKALMKDPERVQLTENKERHDLIHQVIYQADNMDHKLQILNHHLQCETVKQALIFTSTKRNADFLSRRLSEIGHDSAPLHGDMTQNARRRTMNKMLQGNLRFLIATDVAARGLDIKGISHVINYDMPNAAEDYIHRIGRTGRAGVNGMAISLVGPQDWRSLACIERMTGESLKRCTIPGLEPKLLEPKIHSGIYTRSFRPTGRRGRPRAGIRRRRLLG